MCTCSVGKGVFFFPFFVQLRYWYNSYHSYVVVVITEILRALFSGGALPDHFHSELAECLSALTVFPSLSTAELRVSLGSCFWPVVWQLRLALSAQPLLQPPPRPLPPFSSAAHTCPSMLGSFQEDSRRYEEPDGTQWSETSCSNK